MRVRVGIVGAGAIVRDYHLPALRRLSNLFEVTAICGRTPTHAQTLATEVGAILCEDFEQVLAHPKVDAVIVAVPIEHTFRIAMHALERGKHILLEKPLAASLVQADALVRRAASSPAVAMVAQQSCYWSWVRTLSQFLQTGSIGRLDWIDVSSIRWLVPESIAAWRAKPHHPAGFFWDGGVHWTSILRMLVGELQSGTALLGEFAEALGGPEGVTCHFRTNRGVSGVLTYRRRIGCAPQPEAAIQLVGSEGSISATSREIVLSRRDGPTERHRVEPDSPFLVQLQHFHACTRGATSVNPLSEGESDLRTVAQVLRWAGFRDERIREVEGKPSLAETSTGRSTISFAESCLEAKTVPPVHRQPPEPPTLTDPARTRGLSSEECQAYERDGFLGPLPLLGTEETGVVARAGQGFRAGLQAASQGEFLGPQLFHPLPWFKSAHVYVPAIRDLCLDERVLALVRSLMGPNLISWGADYIERKAGHQQRWHVDVETLDFESLNVWIGLRRSDATALKIMRGSRDLAPPQELILDRTRLDDDEAVLDLAQRQDSRASIEKLWVPPGHCALFSGRLWHATSQAADRSSLLLQYSREGARVRVPTQFDPPYAWHELPPPCFILPGD